MSMRIISAGWACLPENTVSRVWHQGNVGGGARQSLSGTIDEELFHCVQADEKVTVKDVTLYPIRTSHDAAEPVAYRISP